MYMATTSNYMYTGTKASRRIPDEEAALSVSLKHSRTPGPTVRRYVS